MQQDLTAGQVQTQQAQPHRCAMAKAGVTAAALLTTATLLLLLLLLLNPLGAAGDDDGSVQDLRYRRRRGFRHRNAPQQTPAAPAQPVHPTPPPPPPRCNNSYAPEDSLTASGDDQQCVPVPARPPSPPVVPPPRRRPLLRCPPCTCPRPQPQPPRPFTGWPWPAPRPLPVPGGRGSNTPDNGGAYDCVAPLAPLTTCGPFITGNETETPTPASECCDALAAFLSASSAAAAAGGGDHMLRCLCPVILGDVNRVMPRPVDPVRMMYLPIACGVVLPPQILYACFTGRPSPVVTNLPQVTDPTIEAPP